MKLLLIQPSQWYPVRKGYKIPLGLAYIASYLKSKGHKVEGIDFNYPFGREGERYLREDREVLDSIVAIAPDVVGMTCYSHNRYNAYFWADVIKRRLPGTRIVLGGPHVTFLADQILGDYPQIDFIIRYEGERPFASLLEALESGSSLHDVPNLAFRQRDGRVVLNECEPVYENLDDLPFPDRTFFQNGEQLIRAGQPIDNREDLFPGPALHVITSRGCPFKCKFCCASFYLGEKARYRSPENVVEELVQLRNRWPDIRSLIFHDDTMTIKRSHLEGICRLMIEKRLDYRWAAWSRINVLDSSSIRLMRDAGCVLLKSGIESGSQRVLDLMGKKVSVDVALKNIRLVRDEKMDATYNFLFGYPGETLGEAFDTIDFIRRAGLSNMELRTATAPAMYPGTELTRQYARHKHGLNWDNPSSAVKQYIISDPMGNPLYPQLNLPASTSRMIKKAIRAPRLNELEKNGFRLPEDHADWSEAPFQYMQMLQIAGLSRAIGEVDPNGHRILIVGEGPVEYCLFEGFRNRGYQIERAHFAHYGNPEPTIAIPTLVYPESCFDYLLVMNKLKDGSNNRFLEDLLRVMKPGGTAVFVELNMAHLFNRIRLLVKGSTMESADFPNPPSYAEARNNLKQAGFNIRCCKGQGIHIPSLISRLMPESMRFLAAGLRMPGGQALSCTFTCTKS